MRISFERSGNSRTRFTPGDRIKILPCRDSQSGRIFDELLKQNDIYARLWRKHIGMAEMEQKAEERGVEELFEGE